MADDELELDYADQVIDDDQGFSYQLPNNKLEKLKQFFQSKQGIQFLVVVALVVLMGCLLFAGQLVVGYYVLNHETSNQTDSVVPDAVQKFWADLAAEIHATMDNSTDPCVDFYQYSCGGWLAVTEIPADQGSVTKSFQAVSDKNEVIINEILNAGWPMVSTLYDDCMNMRLRNQLGNRPLAPWIQLVDQMTVEDLARVVGLMHHNGFGGLFDFDVSPDLLNPTVNRFELDQGGLGLPSKNYYSNSTAYQDIQAAYLTRVSTTLGLIQDLITQPDSETQLSLDQQASDIFGLELQLAAVSKSPLERRDIEALYNPTNRADFVAGQNNFDWELYFDQIQLADNVRTINLVVPEFFSGLNVILPTVPLPLLKNYLRWNIALYSSKLLSQDFYDAYFAYLMALDGIEAPPPLSKTCTSAVNNILGMLVGRYFIQEAWSDASQQEAQDLITTIKDSFNQDLQTVSWMDNTTRTAALGKLDAVNDKVGHPSQWPSYDQLNLYVDQYFNNTLAGWKFEIDNMMAEADQSVDKAKWDMYPQTVNAYYDPQLNEMVFPAAILQEPFFNELYPHAVNYGGIGAVMGHELTHGFDDQGRQFDATGAYRQWWTQSSIDNFDTQAQCVVDLYDQFEVQPGVYVNGAQTEGENIADLGGVKDAYRALKTAMSSLDPEVTATVERIFGMTVDQLFFVSYGQVWCSVSEPAYEAFLANIDVHSPSKARVINPLSQFETFAATYQCPADSPMNPQTRCNVW